MWKRWLVFLKWSRHTVQKRTVVPWRLVLLPSLSCSLTQPCSAAQLSEAGKPRPSQWRPPTPDRGNGCAQRSIRPCGLLLSWAFFIHSLCFWLFSGYSKEVQWAAIHRLLGGSWTCPGRLSTQGWEIHGHTPEWVPGIRMGQDLSSPSASCWKYSVPLHLLGLLSWRPTGHMSEKNVPQLLYSILLPSGSGRTIHPLLSVCPL